MKSQEIRNISLGLLVGHPENVNVMSVGVMRKVRKHIERTGRYEPLVVRPHPREAGCFELINGHHRKEILEGLGYTEAACVVWDLTDGEALLLLATINRLSGEDSPGKRLKLLEHLAADMEATAGEIAALLPETEGTIERVLGRHVVQEMEAAPDFEAMPEALTFFMSGREKRRVLGVLRRTDKDAGVALQIWATEREGKTDK